MPHSLDQQYGPVPWGNNTDPSHLQALATRLEALSGKIDVMTEGGRGRDQQIADLRQDVAEMTNKVDAVLKHPQLTEEEIKTLRAIMLGRDRTGWLWARVRLYAYWAVGTVSGIILFRDSIRQFLGWFGITIK